jgi:hypothetical protein
MAIRQMIHIKKDELMNFKDVIIKIAWHNVEKCSKQH